MILLFTACLLASPVDCWNERMPLSEATPLGCLFQAQPLLAAWSEGHPARRVANYRCVAPGRWKRVALCDW